MFLDHETTTLFHSNWKLFRRLEAVRQGGREPLTYGMKLNDRRVCRLDSCGNRALHACAADPHNCAATARSMLRFTKVGWATASYSPM